MIISQNNETMIPYSSIGRLQFTGVESHPISKPYFVINTSGNLRIKKYIPYVYSLTAFMLDGKKEKIGYFRSPSFFNGISERGHFLKQIQEYACDVRNGSVKKAIKVPDFRCSCEIHLETFDKVIKTTEFADEMSDDEFVSKCVDLLSDYNDYIKDGTKEVSRRIYNENIRYFQEWRVYIGV